MINTNDTYLTAEQRRAVQQKLFEFCIENNLPPYLLLDERQLGSGTSACVYQLNYFQDNVIGIIHIASKYAVKICKIDTTDSDSEVMIENVYVEYAIALKIRYEMQQNDMRCPVVRPFGYFTVKSGLKTDPYIMCCIIMEHCLPLVTKEDSGFDDIHLAVRLGHDLLPLLQYTFELKIVHCDIKRNNIFLSNKLFPLGTSLINRGTLLGDWGIATSLLSDEKIPRIGTEVTAAPEIWNSDTFFSNDSRAYQNGVDQSKCDLYSLALVMYYYLNGRKYPDCSARLANCWDYSEPAHGSKELKNVIMKALQYLPDNRYSSPDEMLLALQKCAEYEKYIPEKDQHQYVPSVKPAERKTRPIPPEELARLRRSVLSMADFVQLSDQINEAERVRFDIDWDEQQKKHAHEQQSKPSEQPAKPESPLPEFDPYMLNGFAYQKTENGAMITSCSKNDISITIPNGVTVICASAFEGMQNLQRIDIPDSVTVIGCNAFANCINLRHVKIGCRVQDIGEYAFFGCSNLNELILPKSIKKIGRSALCSLKQVKAYKTADSYDYTIDPGLRWNIIFTADELCAQASRLNQTEAIKKYTLALELEPDHVGAAFSLAEIYILGYGGTAGSRKAISLYKSIASQHATAAFRLGRAYKSGFIPAGINPDPKKAIDYFLAAKEINERNPSLDQKALDDIDSMLTDLKYHKTSRMTKLSSESPSARHGQRKAQEKSSDNLLDRIKSIASRLIK